jgi:hypothetical protein
MFIPLFIKKSVCFPSRTLEHMPFFVESQLVYAFHPFFIESTVYASHLCLPERLKHHALLILWFLQMLF